jgi:hypothetical protein
MRGKKKKKSEKGTKEVKPPDQCSSTHSETGKRNEPTESNLKSTKYILCPQ